MYFLYSVKALRDNFYEGWHSVVVHSMSCKILQTTFYDGNVNPLWEFLFIALKINIKDAISQQEFTRG